MRGYSFFYALIALILYGGVLAAQTDGSDGEKKTTHGMKILSDAIEKSQSDHREYRMIELPNHMRVLLISDPKAETSAASLDVGVGHFSDPEEVPGLAHFCEHLLFMGTKKYPDENDFSSFLSDHSGRYNAYTSTENTNYYFSIAHEHFEPALDRFAQFFISPLFSRSSVDREAHAVDLEFKKNLQDDEWRMFQLEKSLSGSGTPYSKFGTGSYETLIVSPKEKGEDVIDVLLKFHSTYYSANIMTLAVLSKETLDELEALVLKYFSEVPNNGVQKPDFGEYSFSSMVGKQYWYKPVLQRRSLELAFPMKDTYQYYKDDPTVYLKYLLEHRASGSLFSSLLNYGWATSLEVKKEYIVSGVDFFRISVTLTERGLSVYEKVVAMVFKYLETLRAQAPHGWISDELKTIHANSFRFQELPLYHTYVSTLSRKMQDKYVLPSDILITDVFKEHNDEAIRKILGFLTKDNLILTIVGKESRQSWDQVEKWYGSQYSISEFTDSLKRAFEYTKELDNVEFKLPSRNKFIPTMFFVRNDTDAESSKPELVHDNEFLRFWHKTSVSPFSPKSHLSLLIKSNEYHGTARRSAHAMIYVKMLLYHLRDTLYYASIAGNSFSLDVHSLGIQLQIYAYTDKVYELLQIFVQALVDYEPDLSDFFQFKRELIATYKNIDMINPYKHLSYDIGHLYIDKTWSRDKLYESIKTLTFTEIRNFYAIRLSYIFVEGLLVGGASKNFSDFVEHLLNQTSLTPAYTYRTIQSRTYLLDKGDNFIFETNVANPLESNSGILYSIQLGDIKDSKLLAFIKLLHFMIKERAFDQLRAKEQLGYVVKTFVGETGTILDYRIMVQSSRDPFYLEQRIIAFLYRVAAFLETMTDSEYDKYLYSLTHGHGLGPGSIKGEASGYWDDIVSGVYEFQRYKRLRVAFKELKREEFKKMFYKYIYPGPSQKKISVHLKSQTLEDVSVKDISPQRLYHFLKCRKLEIGHYMLVSFVESSPSFDAFQQKLVDYLSSKYPDRDVSTIVKQAFQFLKKQYHELKQKAVREYGAVYFSDVSELKTFLRMAPIAHPMEKLGGLN